MVRQFFSGFKA